MIFTFLLLFGIVNTSLYIIILSSRYFYVVWIFYDIEYNYPRKIMGNIIKITHKDFFYTIYISSDIESRLAYLTHTNNGD